MILHPAIIVLFLVSFLTTGMVLYATSFGIQIIRNWDITSGSERQLALERKTYLISSLLSYMLFFQIGSLFLFIFTADSLHNLFIGAMCAAGTLNVNAFGYPVFVLKIVNFILAGLWLVFNYIDNRGYDYPLIKKKYAMLLILAPFLASEALLQGLYFAGLKSDVITSCCGSLFGAGRNTVASDIAAFPPATAMIWFYASMAITLGTGFVYLGKGLFDKLFSFSSGVTFLISAAAFISFITLYFYEIPTHHCPFCILQSDYGYIGYLFYAALLTGAVSGLSVGLLSFFKKQTSLSTAIPQAQKKLASVCLGSYLLFLAIFLIRLMNTDFALLGS